MRSSRWIGAVAALALAACADTEPTGPGLGTGPAAALTASQGGVYTMTNGAAGNEVLQYRRDAAGTLTQVGGFPTGGTGTGTGLGNQGGLVVSDDGRWLLAVNAGSNDVSVFRRDATGGLTLAGRTPSGGTAPVSVTQRGPWVWVLNEGGAGNIAGFRLNGDGSLSPVGTQPLSQAGGVDAAQIGFSANGRALVVTEKNTNRIVVYPVQGGIAGAPRVHGSDGETPFGFAFTQDGTLIVSNAAGGAAGAATVTSYRLGADGSLSVISSRVPDFQAAACWIAVSRNGRFAYTTNTATNNTSGYIVGPTGTLSLLDASGVTASNSGGPIDASFNASGAEFLHVLNARTGRIEVFSLDSNGGLTFVSEVSGLPAGTNGVAAY